MGKMRPILRRRQRMTYPRVGLGILRDNKRIDEKRRRTVLRIIQGSNKYGLRTGGSQLDLSYTIRDNVGILTRPRHLTTIIICLFFLNNIDDGYW